jgi:hypothetical protein
MARGVELDEPTRDRLLAGAARVAMLRDRGEGMTVADLDAAIAARGGAERVVSLSRAQRVSDMESGDPRPVALR